MDVYIYIYTIHIYIYICVKIHTMIYEKANLKSQISNTNQYKSNL